MSPEVDSTEMPGYFNQITRRKIPKDTIIHNKMSHRIQVILVFFFLCWNFDKIEHLLRRTARLHWWMYRYQPE